MSCVREDKGSWKKEGVFKGTKKKLALARMCVFRTEEAACMKEMSKEGKKGALSQRFQEDLSTLVRFELCLRSLPPEKWCC